MLRINYENDQELVEISSDVFTLCERALNEVIGEMYSGQCLQVDITFVNNERIQTINSEFRRVNQPTDVLSFPMNNMTEGVLNEGEAYEIDPETDCIVLGDIILSVEKCVAQAQEYGHSFERELLFLLTHGMCHLLGYDHVEEEDGKKMFAKQEAVLTKIGFER